MTLLAVGVLSALFGLTVGVLAGFALAGAPTMPVCALCEQELDHCTCYGIRRAEARTRQEPDQTNGDH